MNPPEALIRKVINQFTKKKNGVKERKRKPPKPHRINYKEENLSDLRRCGIHVEWGDYYVKISTYDYDTKKIILNLLWFAYLFLGAQISKIDEGPDGFEYAIFVSYRYFFSFFREKE